MPPKKFGNFSNVKTAKESLSEAKSGDLKQVTISKFFAFSNKRKNDEVENNKIEIVIDSSDDKAKNFKERAVESPLKKKPKTSIQNASESPLNQKSPSGSSLKLVTSSCQGSLDKTRDKLSTFAASTDVSKASVSEFDYNLLKRNRAACLPDINCSVADSNDSMVSIETCDNDADKSVARAEPQPSTSGAIRGDSATNASKSAVNKTQASSVKCSGKMTQLKTFSRDSQKKDNLLRLGTKVKYTQLEQQYVEIRDKYPGTVLLVECGYKYRFFGDDAQVAADVLKIFCHQDHNFLTASIPVHRLFVHVRRLVSAGYKVGVVKQTETAALKAAGTNKNTPFTRELTALYTKSTLLGEDVEGVSTEADSDLSSMTTTYLMCICDSIKGIGSKGRQSIGIVAVQPSTGDLLYDCFDDTDSRVELETRLAHIQPVEVILSSSGSSATDKLLNSLQAISHHADDKMRIEKVDNSMFEYTTAFRVVSEHMANAKGDNLQEVVNLPNPVICCLAALIAYLKDFNLHKVLRETSRISRFSTYSKYMQLPSGTLHNLELFTNSTDGNQHGSLFWALNQTVTRPGARMLRAWLSQPLLSYRDIMARQSAIDDCISERFSDRNNVRNVLSKVPDLERGLTAVFHKKSSPCEFFCLCKALQTLKELLMVQKAALNDKLTSLLLTEIMSEVPELLSDITEFSGALAEQSARANDKTTMFVDDSISPDIVSCKQDIKNVETALHDHRRDVRLTIHQPSLEYTTVLGTEFLVEVKNTNLSSVPRDWVKISSTKAVSRFHSPFIVEKYRELQQLRERLNIICQEAWIRFLEMFSKNYQRYKKAIHLVSTLDCLLSLATVAQNHGYCRPEMVEDTMCIEIQDGYHPVIQRLIGENQQYVPNSTHLVCDGSRVMIITGPNMGGKSSYIKQVAVLCIMAQVGSYVPAQSAKLGIFDAVYSRMGAMDEIYKGRSTFMVELQEASEVIAKATSRSLVILDELGRGTSTHDGVAIAWATLDFFIQEPKCITLFVTHYPSLAEFENQYPGIVGNYHMSYLLHDEEADTGADVITFLYQLVQGVAAGSYGLNVATLAQIPQRIVRVAASKSLEMQSGMAKQRKEKMILRRLFEDHEVHKNLQDVFSSQDPME